MVRKKQILLHANHAAKCKHQKILIHTADTGVVVLAIALTHSLPSTSEMFIAFGFGKGFRYIPVRDIASSLGREKSLALPVFHAVTGCDTVSAFVGHGKRIVWSTWNWLCQN